MTNETLSGRAGDEVLFEKCLGIAQHLPEKSLLGWLLYLASLNSHTQTTLLEEIRRMATNDAQLTQAVNDLLSGYTALTAAIMNEISALKATGLDGADPAISSAVTNIESVVTQMQQATAAAQAAIAPAPSTDSSDANPPAASASGSADAAAGDSSGAAAATTDAGTTTDSTSGSSSDAGGSTSTGSTGS